MTKRAIVFGAGGAVGEAIAHALIAGGWSVTASMRRQRDDVTARLSAGGAVVRYDDLDEAGEWVSVAAECDAIIFVTHLGIANLALLRMPLAAQRIVVFSSNNVAVQPKSKVYAEIAEAERGVRKLCPDAAIVRPTLIYGDPRLPTVTRLMRMARSWPFVPMPGPGRALLQPVFHEDLARAAAWLAGASGAGTYAIGGPENITMRGLYRAVVRMSGRKVRILAVPLWLLRIVGPVLSALGLFSSDQTSRANRDRLAVKQTPLPPEIVAKVGLKEGLARLAAAMQAQADGSLADGR
jgi:nucleoside-diphosphate-sugar epimerase